MRPYPQLTEKALRIHLVISVISTLIGLWTLNFYHTVVGLLAVYINYALTRSSKSYSDIIVLNTSRFYWVFWHFLFVVAIFFNAVCLYVGPAQRSIIGLFLVSAVVSLVVMTEHGTRARLSTEITDLQ